MARLPGFDRAGALRVGPESAGADPGPICYGRGETEPTVTDAHLVLGHIPERGFLSGDFPLDVARTRKWMERSRGPMRTIEQFAQGIVDVANAVMEKAIRVISVERGHDPRDYTLVAFGGAGGLHACDLARHYAFRALSFRVCPAGSLRWEFCAQTWCMIIRARCARSLVLRGRRDVNLHLNLRNLRCNGRSVLRDEGFRGPQVRVERLLDMRYVGQAYELTVPEAAISLRHFIAAHEQRYGYSDAARSRGRECRARA